VRSRPGGWAAFLYVGLAACLPPVSHATPDASAIETTLLLIGDAGEPDPRAELGGIPLDSLTAHAAEAPDRTLVVFLGDNVYPEGIPDEGLAEFADARRRLDAQVRAVPARARGLFIPGNHDWAGEEPDGLFAIRREERLVAALARAAGRDARVLPGHGCPGPVSLDVGRVRLIVLDTQWWLHDFLVRDSTTRCTNTLAGVTSALRREVTSARDERRVAVIAAHHPLMTGGPHGGYCGITGPLRRLAGRSQDVMSRLNERMRDSIEAALEAAPPLVYAGAHDHSLQVLRGGRSAQYVLVSGAGSVSKATCAVRMRESLYTSPSRAGFMRLDILRGGGVLLRVYRYSGAGAGGVTYSEWLEPRP